MLNDEKRRKIKKFLVLSGKSRQGPDAPRGRLVGIWDANLAGAPASLPPHLSIDSVGS